MESICFKYDIPIPEEDQIYKSRYSIEFREGAYYVDLFFREDFID